MKIIKQGDSRVTKIINKKNLNPEAQYRLSIFTYLYQSQGRYLILNTLTFEVMELTESEWKALSSLRNCPADLAYLEANGLIELARSYYLIPAEESELKQYEKILFLLKTMAGVPKGIESYVIFPTTGCNARCTYCYEEGIEIKNMTPETADKLVEFIIETRQVEGDKPITLRWFGGEPLAGAHIIRRICTALSEREVPYRSFMTTNGTLLNPEMAEEAKELWHLEKVQVSLDGAREDYELRKNFFAPEKHNYDAAMRAIRLFSEQGIRVSLRVNVDFENIERIPDFFKELKAEFGSMENIDVYLIPIYQEREKESCINLYKEVYRLTDLQEEMEVHKSARIAGEVNILRTNMCMADAMGQSIVITPDGIFNNCEHLPEKQTWGNIFDGVTDPETEKKLSAKPAIDPTCANCTFLPECTPYFKTGCPGWFSKCYEYHCLKTEYNMNMLLKGGDIESHDQEEI